VFEAYTVGIRISLINGVSTGLSLIGRQFRTTHTDVKALEKRLLSVRTLLYTGAGLAAAGGGILWGISKLAKAGSEYTRQLSLMNAAGMNQLEIANATASAWKTSRDVVTSNATQNLQAIRELRSVFGLHHMAEAYSILPTVQRTKAVLEALTGKEQEGVAFDMVKAIELRTPGLMTAARMQQNADLMARSLMAMGGTINVNDFHMALKQAKTSAFRLSDAFVYELFPTLMQEVKTRGGGAQSAGTALMTSYQAVINGRIMKSALPVWEKMGLIDPRNVVRNATGSMQLRPGAVRQAQLFQENPFLWANQVLAPAIAAYAKGKNLNTEQVLAGMFRDRNTQWFFNTLINKAAQFKRDQDLIKAGGSSKAVYDKLVKTNPQLAAMALQAKWNELLSQLGYSIMPKLLEITQNLLPILERATDWVRNNKDAVGWWIVKLGELSVVMIGLSGVAVIGAAINGFKAIKEVLVGRDGLISAASGATKGLGNVARGLIALSVATYLWDKPPTTKGRWGAFWNDPHWVEKRLGLYGGPHDQWDDEWSGRKGGSPYVQPPKQMGAQAVILNMDGKKVGEGVLGHINKAMGLNNDSASFFDPNIHVLPVAAGAN
jgi:hypothetical protein